jgi:hypothetical protein
MSAKKHGLWRFHYEAKRVEKHGARWWIDEELPMVRRLIESLHSGYGGRWTYSNADAIVTCAFRYVRRFKVECSTVRQWNELVAKIAGRCGYTHTSTMRSAQIHGLINARLDWTLPEWWTHENRTFVPSQKWTLRDVERRLERWKANVKKKPCRWCCKPTVYKDQWQRYDGSIRCNAPDCRRMDYLEHVPQSRGGIDLTPAQRRELVPQAWPQQRAINYLLLRSKELKRATRANHVIR